MTSRNHVTIRFVLVLAPLLATLDVVGAQQNIPEALAAGIRGRHRWIGSGQPPSVADLLQQTDLIVRGTVGDGRSYLSVDQRDVYTEYPIINPVVLHQHGVVASQIPSAASALKVVQLGGTIYVDGTAFTHREESLPPLEPGTEGLFLLQRVGDEYRIAGTFFGAFGVAEGRVHPLTRKEGFAVEYRGRSARDTIRDLLELASTVRR